MLAASEERSWVTQGQGEGDLFTVYPLRLQNFEPGELLKINK